MLLASAPLLLVAVRPPALGAGSSAACRLRTPVRCMSELEPEVNPLEELVDAVRAGSARFGDSENPLAALINATLADLQTPLASREEWKQKFLQNEDAADFVEPGGPYEIDLDEWYDLERDLREAQRRRISKGLDPVGSPLEDDESVLYKLVNDPVDGWTRVAARQEAASALKGRLNPFVRLALMLGPVWAARTAPAQTARLVLLSSAMLHLVVPAIQLASSAHAARQPSTDSLLDDAAAASAASETAPYAEAGQVLSSQHLLSATMSAIITSAFFRGGALLDGFLFLITSRVCMLIGLWYWSDLNQALLQPPLLISGHKQQTGLPRLWRLLTSILCATEVSLFGRIFFEAAALHGSSTGSQVVACPCTRGLRTRRISMQVIPSSLPPTSRVMH